MYTTVIYCVNIQLQYIYLFTFCTLDEDTKSKTTLKEQKDLHHWFVMNLYVDLQYIKLDRTVDYPSKLHTIHYQNLSLLTLKYPAITFPPVFLMPSMRKHHVEPNAPTKKSASAAIQKLTIG